jgi:GNAT superfamily N-acetyltransferase
VEEPRLNDLIITAVSYAEARELVAASIVEMGALYTEFGFFDPSRDVPREHFEAPDGVFLVARLDGRAVACGGLRRFDDRSAEIKRMYTDPSVRGRGVARRVLQALESAARTAGYERVVLETGTLQPHAVALYRSAGFVPMPCYGEYVHDPHSVCFEKELPDR